MVKDNFIPVYQMIESNTKKDLQNAKLYPETLDWIKDEQRRIEKAFGRKPTVAEIIADELRKAHNSGVDAQVTTAEGETVLFQVKHHGVVQDRSSGNPAVDKLSLKAHELPWVARLLAVLRSGDQQSIEAVEMNLGLFARHHLERDHALAALAASEPSSSHAEPPAKPAKAGRPTKTHRTA